MLKNSFTRIDRFFLALFPFFILLLIFSYLYIKDIQEKNLIYFTHNDKINSLIEIDTFLDEFINKKIELIIFDDVASKINTFEDIIVFLIADAIQHNFDHNYIGKLKNISKVFENKKLQIQRLKARKAFAYNTLTYMIDISDVGYIELDEHIRQKVDYIKLEFAKLSLGFETFENIESQVDALKYYEQNNGYIINFIRLTQALKNHYKEINDSLKKISNINLHLQLQDLKNHLNTITLNDSNRSFYVIDSGFLMVLFLSLFIIYVTWILYKTKKDLISFKTAVENSHSVIVMTDVNQNIVFVNETFEKVTGYSANEAIGLKPNVLKSGVQDDSFYEEMAKKIFSGQKWHGRFVNRKKNGELFYEDATITPIVLNGKIEGYLAIKLDVTEMIEYSNQLADLNNNLEKKVEEKVALLRQKEEFIQRQSRLAALGEMIGNIAHQWRQPLSSITIGASGLKYKKELGILKIDETFDKELDNIIAGAEYLSQTIEDFRNFAKVDRKKTFFDISDTIEKTYKVVKNLYESNNIDVVFDLQKPMLFEGYESELSQVIINILNNAKDALIEKNKDHKHRKIFVRTFQNELKIIIHIVDNAGGINDDIKQKIFDPYFTTKHQSQGTGIGLFMSYEIIKNHFDGLIDVKNEKVIIEENEYIGAFFTIELPIKAC